MTLILFSITHQILNEMMYIWYNTNTIWKGINSAILPPNRSDNWLWCGNWSRMKTLNWNLLNSHLKKKKSCGTSCLLMRNWVDTYIRGCLMTNCKSWKVLYAFKQSYNWKIIFTLYISWPTIFKSNLKAPFSIATTLKCRSNHYSFPWIAPLTLHPYLIMLG